MELLSLTVGLLHFDLPYQNVVKNLNQNATSLQSHT